MCLSITVYSGTIIDRMMSCVGLEKLPPTKEHRLQASSGWEALSIYWPKQLLRTTIKTVCVLIAYTALASSALCLLVIKNIITINTLRTIVRLWLILIAVQTRDIKNDTRSKVLLYIMLQIFLCLVLSYSVIAYLNANIAPLYYIIIPIAILLVCGFLISLRYKIQDNKFENFIFVLSCLLWPLWLLIIFGPNCCHSLWVMVFFYGIAGLMSILTLMHSVSECFDLTINIEAGERGPGLEMRSTVLALDITRAITLPFVLFPLACSLSI